LLLSPIGFSVATAAAKQLVYREQGQQVASIRFVAQPARKLLVDNIAGMLS
jgi:hypothetical protein